MTDVLRSGWLTTGPRVKEFETALADFCGAAQAVCMSSATAALELTLRMLEIGPGDEVILPAYTYTATAGAVCHTGAYPILVDCEPPQPGDFCFEMDPQRLENAITSRTKAIIAVDFAGRLCNYPRFLAVAERKKATFFPKGKLQRCLGRIAVIADAAHALGAVSNGTPCGVLADFTCFSFHAVKNLTTGEGGAVVWPRRHRFDNGEAAQGFRLLSLHGQDKDAMAKNRSGCWEYDILTPGYKCNMTDISAALGLAQLRRYPEMLERRRERIEQYDRLLAGLGVETLRHSGPGFCSSGHLYPVRLTGFTAEMRGRVIDRLAQDGITANVHYKPLPLLTAYRNMGYRIEDYPNAYSLYQNEITLPLYSQLTGEQVEAVVSALKNAMEEEEDGVLGT